MILRYVAGKEFDVSTISAQVLQKPNNMLVSDVEVHVSVVTLDGFNSFGIEVRKITEDKQPEDANLFFPWGAVLAIQGGD